MRTRIPINGDEASWSFAAIDPGIQYPEAIVSGCEDPAAVTHPGHHVEPEEGVQSGLTKDGDLAIVVTDRVIRADQIVNRSVHQKHLSALILEGSQASARYINLLS